MLDVGAGLGRFAEHVPREAYLGLETDADAVAVCANAGIRVLNLDMQAYRTSPDHRPADLVTAFQVLEHVAAPDQFVAEMFALARPGGRIVLGVPDAASYGR